MSEHGILRGMPTIYHSHGVDINWIFVLVNNRVGVIFSSYRSY